MDFAHNLRTRIADLGLSYAEVARRCQLENRRFHHYTVGDREPDLKTLIRIAEVLETTPDALLGVRTEPSTGSEQWRLRTQISAAAATMDLATLRLLHLLANAVVMFMRGDEPRRTSHRTSSRPARGRAQRRER